MPDFKFRLTRHVRERALERGLSLEDVRAVVRAPETVKHLGHGPHGGLRRKFSKSSGARRMIVVAEIKGKDCWLVTAYYG